MAQGEQVARVEDTCNCTAFLIRYNTMALNKNIRILLTSSNIWYFGEGMLGPLFAVFTERVGGDILDVSWGWATDLIFAGHLFFVQAGLGVGLAMATPTWNALYAKHEDRKHDGFEWGLAGGMAKVITG